ncbi:MULTISPECIES: serine/threonine-protein kinase [Streptomyces]|nr:MULTISPECIES: serine/threonine-protein kinase [Streptomyces]
MPDERIGEYLIERLLGSGGMGTVYLGRSPSGRAVAIKVIRAEFAADPAYRARFRQEVEAARRVGGFHTAAVVDADPDAPEPWMASAYVQGPTLADAIDRQGPFDERWLKALGAGLAEALKAIHACGLVHRDLKPANIVLTHDGPRVLDFGIARVLEETRLTAAGSVVGTPGFAAPEQLRGRPVGGACDVFALGAVLVAAAGGRAFGSGDALLLAHRVTAEEADVSAVPDGLREVVLACLRKEPAERPTPDELLRIFTTRAAPGSPGSTSPGLVIPASRPAGEPAPGPPSWPVSPYRPRPPAPMRSPGLSTALQSPSYVRGPRSRALLSLWSLLLAAGLAGVQRLGPGSGPGGVLVTVAVSVAGLVPLFLLLRSLGVFGRYEGIWVGDDGITVLCVRYAAVLSWTDIEALELDLRTGARWLAVRISEDGTPLPSFVKPRWVSRTDTGEIRIRTGWLTPFLDSVPLPRAIRFHAQRHHIPVTELR